MSKVFPFVLPSDVAPKLTQEQFDAIRFIGKEKTFVVSSAGVWSLPTTIRGLTIEKIDGEMIVHGVRTMSDLRECGFASEGRVCVNGRKLRAFTSSQLFTAPDGTLVKAAILYLCQPRKVMP